MNQATNETPGEYDPLAEDPMPATERKPEGRRKLKFYDPLELANYKVPEGYCLVGDMHLTEGGVFVLGGASGIGKSRALTALAVSGATRKPWFGMPVHRKFKTLIIQAENGLVRLSAEYGELDATALQGWVKVSGNADTLDFADLEVKRGIQEVLLDFRPDLVVLDPWNRATRDNMEKDYRETFNSVLACLDVLDPRPALVICAHTRKPRQGEKAHGRGLLNLLSGSLVLGSLPRSAFILQTATDDPEDNRIVFTCTKNNDGKHLGAPSAWNRAAKGYEGPIEDFDWDEFYGESTMKKPAVTVEHLKGIFDDGKTWLSKSDAAKQLMAAADVGRSTAYDALKIDGKFAKVLREHPVDGRLNFKKAGEWVE